MIRLVGKGGVEWYELPIEVGKCFGDGITTQSMKKED